jgi:tetratricopeptide (TPR) repeat protein
VVVGAAAPARADGGGDDFWASLLTPHAEEVALVLAKARELRQSAFNQFGSTYETGRADPSTMMQQEQSRLRLQDAFGMLRYARRELDPAHPEVLFELGRTAEDIGRHADAADALRAFLDVVGDATPWRGAEAHFRLGRIHARFGEWDESIAQLRRAAAVRGSHVRPAAKLALGCAYMQADRLPDAIDVLRDAVAGDPPGSGYYMAQAAAFALAVAYDRDGQVSRSHEVLDQLLAYDPSLGQVLGYGGGEFPLEPLLVPPAERSYFQALSYEAQGRFDDARVEWQAYARATDSPYRRRALAHVAAIDALREKHENLADDPTRGQRVFVPPPPPIP